MYQEPGLAWLEWQAEVAEDRSPSSRPSAATNGSAWQVHVTGGLPVTIDLTLEADLLG
jgi:hypothetical protein